MANVNIKGCIEQTDGKLVFVDDNACDVTLSVCMNASGKLWVYHEGCDGFEGSDGWYEVCINSNGKYQITIPDDCCGPQCQCPLTAEMDFLAPLDDHDTIVMNQEWEGTYCYFCDADGYGEGDEDEWWWVNYKAADCVEIDGTWHLYAYLQYNWKDLGDEDWHEIGLLFHGTRATCTGEYSGTTVAIEWFNVPEEYGERPDPYPDTAEVS